MFFHFVLLKKQCNLFTDCIAFWVLTFFPEFGAAFGAGYDDLAFTLGDADFLATARTLVDVVGFAVGQVSFPVIYFVFYLILPGQKFLVLGVAAIIIAGEHTVVAADQDCHDQADDNIVADEDVQDYQNQGYRSQKTG